MAAETGLDVVSKEEVQARLADLRASATLAGVTGENHVRVARAMRTDLVLIAEITSLDDLLSFDLQLVDARTGYVVHGDTVRRIAQSDVEREGVPAVKRMLGFVPHRGFVSRRLIAGGAVAGLAGGQPGRTHVSAWNRARPSSTPRSSLAQRSPPSV